MLRTIIIAAALSLSAAITFATAAHAASEKQIAARAATATRMKACGAEWKTAKADDAVKAAGWPKFWSACNKRLKAAQ